MMIVPLNSAAEFRWLFTRAGAAATDLADTPVDVVLQDGTVVTGTFTLVHVTGGLYSVSLSSSYTATPGRISAVAMASDDTLNAQILCDEVCVLSAGNVSSIAGSATAAAVLAMMFEGSFSCNVLSAFNNILTLDSTNLPRAGWRAYCATYGEWRIVQKREIVGGTNYVVTLDRAFDSGNPDGLSVMFVPDLLASMSEDTSVGLAPRADLQLVEGQLNANAVLRLTQFVVQNDSDNAVVFKSTSGAHAGLRCEGDAYGLYCVANAGANGTGIGAQSDDPAGIGMQCYGAVGFEAFGTATGDLRLRSQGVPSLLAGATTILLAKVNDIASASAIGTAAAAAILATPSNKLVTDGSGRVTSTNGGGGGVEIEVTEVRAR